MSQRTYHPGYPFKITGHFGEERPGKGGDRNHAGVDFGAPEGTAIPAAADGKVVYCRENHSGYGNTVIIEHRNPNGSKFYTLYAHMNNDAKLVPGSEVKAGQKIGEVGTTTERGEERVSPHLHFEVLQPEGEDSNGPFFGSWRDKKRLTFTGENGALGLKEAVGRVNPETYTNYHGDVFGKGHPDHRTAADRTHRGGNGGHGDGETLERHGEEIYRIEADGSMRGSFQSKQPV